MEVIETTSEDFINQVKTPIHIFASGEFNELNKGKCEKLHFLIFNDNGNRLSLILGAKGDNLFSPFSAPFGGFSPFSHEFRFKYLDESVRLLNSWASSNNYSKITITLPPPIYNSRFITKQVNSLHRAEYNLEKIDLNFHFKLDTFNETYSTNSWYNARKNLKIGFKSDLEFFRCSNEKEKEIAFEIISENRKQRGYPLRMTLDEVKRTTNIVTADFFLLKEKSGADIASAMVFHLTEDIVQVIYWGDLPAYSTYKTMNFLAFKIFEYYRKEGKMFIDIGPSTENSVPNFGLCEFKESIGCDSELKLQFTKKLN